MYSDSDGAKNVDQIEFFNKLCKYSEIILLNLKFLGQDGLKTSCALISLIRTKCGLKTWSEGMERDYRITFEEFKECYDDMLKYLKQLILDSSPRRKPTLLINAQKNQFQILLVRIILLRRSRSLVQRNLINLRRAMGLGRRSTKRSM
jgi:hypothetical protein